MASAMWWFEPTLRDRFQAAVCEVRMVRVTTLKGDGSAGLIQLKIVSNSKKTDLMRHEHADRHERLVEAAHAAMVANGCYAHKIEVK